ncbi:MAG TPA: hypothetical protein VHI51_21410 [Ktedonobacterales bacterium]|jgi:hypothetical protein|nr:hypothetical protein [Ktedonobacterales bacterium]
MDISAFEGMGDARAAEADYLTVIRAARGNPRRLEDLYQEARRAGQSGRFGAALMEISAAQPEDTLYLAWRYRLESQDDARLGRLGASWRLAVPISVVLALALWITSDPTWTVAGNVPLQVFLWPPLAALAILWYLTLAGTHSAQRIGLAAGVTVALAAIAAYIWFIPSVAPQASLLGGGTSATYLTLMALHLPLMAWAAVGLVALGLRYTARDLFGLLTKSLETIGSAGVYGIAVAVFVGLTYAMFNTLQIELPDLWQRLLYFGGAGLLPVLAVASVYDPVRRAGAQDFYRGFGKILAIIMRLLLPLTLLTLLVYIAFIPFNFLAPFNQRNVLITYNVGLFAVMGLLVGVIPLSSDDVAAQWRGWLRAGIVALAALALLVSLYALSAILYRTVALDGLTMNRLVVIGWNTLNVVLLALALIAQARAGRGDGWVAALQRVARGGALAYIVWGLALILALPWLF